MIINKPYQGFPDSLVGKETTCNAWDPGSIPGWGISTREGIGYPLQYSWASFVTQLVKNPPAMQETWVPSLGRSPGGGKGYPLQYSGPENSVGCIVHGVAKSPTRLSEFHFHFGDFPVAQMVRNQPAMQETRVWSLGQEDLLEKEMATHSSIHAWRIPGMTEPGGLPSMGSHRVGHDWSDLA